MTASPFDPSAGPAGLVDRMIGNEYAVVKEVADALPSLADLLVTIAAVGDLAGFLVENRAARDIAVAARDTTLTYLTQADADATAAAAAVVVGSSAIAAATAAANSQTAAAAAATTAATSASAGAASSALAQLWATKTTAEVVTGQGYGAKKYANDAAASATSAGGSFTLADAARVAAEAARAGAVAISGFDPAPYALKTYAKKVAKRSAMIYGN